MTEAQLDYYAILGVAATATKAQICRAYKTLALAYHPGLPHSNENQSYKKFCLVSQAFDVLYSDQKRSIYDQYGEQRLKEGVVNHRGERQLGNYTLTTEPQAIFQKFFGSKNVYEHLISVGEGEGQSHPIFNAQYGHSPRDSTIPHLVVPVQCRLSELFNGCRKTLTYDKNVLTSDGQSTQVVSETKVIDIEPGRSARNPIVFAQQGNQQPGHQSSDLVFQIVEVDEMGFRRASENPDDIIYTAQISLIEALESRSIQVKDLAGEVVQLHFDEVISPQLVRVLAGKGMPRQGKQGRGNLHVRFNIVFPEHIEIQNKARLVQLLQSLE